MSETANNSGLGQAERKRALAKLSAMEPSEQEGVAAPPGADRRGARRWEYRETDITLTVNHPGGSQSSFSVSARNISSTGIAVLHSGFLYPGSKGRITLRRRDGRTETIDTVIVFCRHVDGRVHEVGMSFGRGIDAAAYVAFGEDNDEEKLKAIEPADLRGNVLYVEDSEADRRLVAHHLRKTGISLSTADTPGAAVDTAKRDIFDIILCDLNLDGRDGVDVIRKIRAGGFEGPIVVVSAETNSARVSAAMEAGANEQLLKPFAPDQLMALMTRLHAEIGAALSASAVESTLEGQDGMFELISAFVNEAKRLAGRLEKAISESDLEMSREISLNVKGTAESYGFARLSAIAAEALTSLDATMSVKESAKLLRKVRLMCENLTVGRPGSTAA